ncbi:hypothetical protein LWI28_012908 [Acer negundo]|uniref:MATH domain-containing protein n=1 Tax=Acer negundo TaxID=4023 RepID=A0AAD5JWG0_ACENE|nr:hypothetical protein LWI28_012908 [Acer negundo]
MAIEMLREERDVQPVQFLLNVDSYSLLPTEQGEKYESEHFLFGGFLWKLILYPNGDKSPNGKGYISFYLENTFIARGENHTVCIDFKCFILNKIKNKYLTIRDGKGALMYFDKLRPVQGFSQMVSIDTFKNPSNGYLVEDACAFGAEFFIIQPSASPARHEFLSLVKDPKGTTDYGRVYIDSFGTTYTWYIRNFTAKLNGNVPEEVPFTIRDRIWFLHMYPKGKQSPNGEYISLYLRVHHPATKVYASGKIRVVNHPENKKKEESFSLNWYDEPTKEWGFVDFMPLSEILEPGNGYIQDDTLLVQLKFDVVSESKTRQ